VGRGPYWARRGLNTHAKPRMLRLPAALPGAAPPDRLRQGVPGVG